MYCPIDGDEFVEGITHCLEHDVDLVEEPPEIDDEQVSNLADFLTEQGFLRSARSILVVAAVAYALSGVASSALFGLGHSALNVTSSIQWGARAVALAALGVIAGAVLMRAYASMQDGETREPPEVDPSPIDPMTRLLFTLLVAFTLVWAVTGIVTARDTAEQEQGVFLGPGAQEEPDESFIVLTAIHYAAYSGGAACLVLMGGRLMVRWHRRLGSNL